MLSYYIFRLRTPFTATHDQCRHECEDAGRGRVISVKDTLSELIRLKEDWLSGDFDNRTKFSLLCPFGVCGCSSSTTLVVSVVLMSSISEPLSVLYKRKIRSRQVLKYNGKEVIWMNNCLGASIKNFLPKSGFPDHSLPSVQGCKLTLPSPPDVWGFY